MTQLLVRDRLPDFGDNKSLMSSSICYKTLQTLLTLFYIYLDTKDDHCFSVHVDGEDPEQRKEESISLTV